MLLVTSTTKARILSSTIMRYRNDAHPRRPPPVLPDRTYALFSRKTWSMSSGFRCIFENIFLLFCKKKMLAILL